MKTLNAGIEGAVGIKKHITAHVDGEQVQILLLKNPTCSDGSKWYASDRMNRLAQINGCRLFGEQTMEQMLKDGSLLEHWLIPEEEIFGTTPEYVAQFA